MTSSLTNFCIALLLLGRKLAISFAAGVGLAAFGALTGAASDAVLGWFDIHPYLSYVGAIVMFGTHLYRETK